MAVAYLCYCLFSQVRQTLVDFCASGDPVIGGFALLLLLLPFLFGASWLFVASGEVMRCDTKELQFARRRTWGCWRRQRFPSVEVRGLKRAIRGGSKSRNYAVLTFQYDGRTFDMLEDLNYTDSDRVLRACKAMGLDVIIVVDPAAPMFHDIAQRGWIINPLRPDRDKSRPDNPRPSDPADTGTHQLP